MASLAKVRQFLDESDTHRHYASIVGYTLTYFIHKAEREGNRRLADDLRKAESEVADEFRKGIEITEEVYREIFTDEELDNLILLHKNSALTKARAMAPEIMNKILERHLQVEVGAPAGESR